MIEKNLENSGPIPLVIKTYMPKLSQCQSLTIYRREVGYGLITFYDAHQLLFQKLLSVGLLQAREAEADQKKRGDEQ